MLFCSSPIHKRSMVSPRILPAIMHKRFHSQREGALTLGDRSRAIGARFATGPQGRIAVGRDCYLNDCILLSEQEISIGDYVMIGWNTTISDCDFHPLDPAARIRDAIATPRS